MRDGDLNLCWSHLHCLSGVVLYAEFAQKQRQVLPQEHLIEARRELGSVLPLRSVAEVH